MIDHAASGVLTASARARVDALVVQTCFAAVTVGVGHAFGPASDVRITEVLR